MSGRPVPTTGTVISEAEIDVDPSSYVDPQGVLFHFDGGLYRLVHAESAPLFRRLLESGTLADLERTHGLVRTSEAAFAVREFPDALVLDHEPIRPQSYAPEWCPSMLQTAATATLDLGLALLDERLMLQDAYPWNVLFRGCEPVFVDLTSIVPLSDRYLWPAHEQFESYFLRPVALSAQGMGRAVRAMLLNNISGVSLAEFHSMVSTPYRLSHPGLMVMRRFDRIVQRSVGLKERVRDVAERATREAPVSARKRLLRRLRTRVAAFSFDRAGDPWSRYYAEIDDGVDKDEKVETVRRLLARLAPRTVVDLGCNTGVFSLLAAEQGVRVVALDSSEACIETLFGEASKGALPILPLVADVLAPTPRFGFMGQQYAGLLERVRSDVAMCLGLMHHLHVSGRQSFERIAALLDAVATKGVIFEYVGLDDANMPHLPSLRPIDYKLEDVMAAISSHFPRIEAFASDRPTRRLLVCER